MLTAIDNINNNGIPENRHSNKYFVIYNDFLYPPKYLVSKANQYANSVELDSTEFSGGNETNNFLSKLGFEIVKKPISLIKEGQKWLAVASPENWNKCIENRIWASDDNRAQQIKRMKKGDEIVIYLTGMKLAGICKIVSDYFYDDTRLWDDGVYPHRIRIEPFLIPTYPIDSKKLYNVYFKYKGSPGGYFGQAIRKLPSEEYSIFQSEILRAMDKLTSWKQGNDREDFDEDEDEDEDEPENSIGRTVNHYVFVTGYDEENLRISKKSNILGWVRNSNYLSKNSLVFVFDKSNLYLDSCFRVVSKSENNGNLVWADEVNSNKVIYNNRWNVELIQDSLKIPLSTINQISPFDKEPFQGLLRGNFPTPLNTPQNETKYQSFREFLIGKLANYWIFIVSDQPKLKMSASDIYQIRMNDHFWGLNNNTPNRKQLKQGDRVIFCHGAKRFLGTAKLASDPFKLTSEQKIKYSHGQNDFFMPEYGVELSDIEIWTETKQVMEYVSQLSFVTNANQFPVYFQGGIKKIKENDYYHIIGNNLSEAKSASNNSFDDRMTYSDLVKFLSEEMEMRANYQPIMIKTLLLNQGSSSKELITSEIRKHNTGIVGDSFLNTVSGVLRSHGIIKISQDNDKKYTLNSVDLTQDQIQHLVELCNQKIKEFTITGHIVDEREVFDDQPLNIPNKEYLENEIKKIREEMLIDEDTIWQIIINLVSGRHILLAGPIGTGKTTLATKISKLLWKDSLGYYPEVHTATSEWSSYDVIGGITPRMRGDEPSYEITLGCVSSSVQSNWSENNSHKRIQNFQKYFENGEEKKEKYRGVWLVIDEFNRAEIDKAFGQLFTALENKRLKIPTSDIGKSFEEIQIPLDYRIIGTLNTVDKHFLFKLSDALKRRFAYIEILPPTEENHESEIYYALKNAMRVLPPEVKEFFSTISLDNASRRISIKDSGDNNSELLRIIYKAYDILKVVRLTKPLGTAILQSIYQTMLMSFYITRDHDKSLDFSLNSNLIPQLENIDSTTLETMYELFCGNVVKFFEEKFNSQERERYGRDFHKFLICIGNTSTEVTSKSKLFFDGHESVNKDFWNKLNESLYNNKKYFNSVAFKDSLSDLIRTNQIY